MQRDFGILQSSFEHCSAITSALGEGARQVITAMSDIGGVFWRGKAGVMRVDEDPFRTINELGHILFGLCFSHPVLERTPYEEGIFRTIPPNAQLTYIRTTSEVNFTQRGDPNQPEGVISLAKGQLALAKIFRMPLRPKFAYVDEMGENAASVKRVKQTQLKYIFWANFYGPAYVEKFGRDLFLNAPGWKKEELDDGGILYVVTENYLDWWQNPPKDVLTYFREHVPDAKLYRAKTRYE